MARYSQPRKLNFVSFFIYLALAAGIYGLVQFEPAYYRKWKAKGILAEAANKIYPARGLQGEAAHDFFNKLRQETLDQLRNLGITDPQIDVRFTKTEKELGAQAIYKEVIHHPLVNKTTTLFFQPKNTIDPTSGFE